MIQIPDEDVYIWSAYDYRCVIHPYEPAVCLHEEPPKSLNPNWKSMPQTRYPVCNSCHESLHMTSREVAIKMLNYYREINFPAALNKLEQHLAKEKD